MIAYFMFSIAMLMDPPAIFQPTGKYAVQDAAAVKSDYYVVMFSASWCGPCRDYKSSGKLDKIKAAGFSVKVVDIDETPEFYRGSIPRLWICRDEKQVHQFPAGPVDPSTVIAKLKSLEAPEAVNHFGRVGTSHESRETLIEHLLEDGIHAGRHTRESLEEMSDQALVELHDLEHKMAGHKVRNGLWKP